MDVIQMGLLTKNRALELLIQKITNIKFNSLVSLKQSKTRVK